MRDAAGQAVDAARSAFTTRDSGALLDGGSPGGGDGQQERSGMFRDGPMPAVRAWGKR